MEEPMETLTRITLSRAEMMKRVARFKELKGFDGGLPDSKMPGCKRTLTSSDSSRPREGGALTTPVGDDASRLAAVKISEGFNLGYCRAKPSCRLVALAAHSAEAAAEQRPHVP
jgi:hypothetical protein